MGLAVSTNVERDAFDSSTSTPSGTKKIIKETNKPKISLKRTTDGSIKIPEPEQSDTTKTMQETALLTDKRMEEPIIKKPQTIDSEGYDRKDVSTWPLNYTSEEYKKAKFVVKASVDPSKLNLKGVEMMARCHFKWSERSKNWYDHYKLTKNNAYFKYRKEQEDRGEIFNDIMEEP